MNTAELIVKAVIAHLHDRNGFRQILDSMTDEDREEMWLELVDIVAYGMGWT